MLVVVARLEKWLTEVEIPIEASQPERVLPPPPHRVGFPHVPTAPLALGLYHIPARGGLEGVLFLRLAGSK